MSNNVISLSQHFRPETSALGNLARNFSQARRDENDVFWLKENAELLNILECTRQSITPSDLEGYQAFYRTLPDRLAFFPQYYRFLISIALDLEALGFEGQIAEQLCHFVNAQGLARAELSDLQRAEAMRLLARRGIDVVGSEELRARLHDFIDHSACFAVPNRKAAYELTHIVFYLSEYGRRDPELSANACQSLMFTGILAYLEENADLLSEVCVALRYAGQKPPQVWEDWINTVVSGFDRNLARGATQHDAYHEFFVTNWARAQMGMSAFLGNYAASEQSFTSPIAPLGAMRAMSEALFHLGDARRKSWDAMESKLAGALSPDITHHIGSVVTSCPEFFIFFEHFSRSNQSEIVKTSPKPTFVLECVQ